MKDNKTSLDETLQIAEKEYQDTMALWEEASTKFSNASLKLFDDMVKFVYRALGSMGLIAGFGFAGIQGVKNFYLFAGGEMVMFIAMIFGIYKIKTIYKSNTDSVDEMRIKIRKVFQKHTSNLNDVIKELKEHHKVSPQLAAEYQTSRLAIPAAFGLDEDPVPEKDESGFITYMIGAFVVGFAILLISFLPIWKVSNGIDRTYHHSRMDSFFRR